MQEMWPTKLIKSRSGIVPATRYSKNLREMDAGHRKSRIDDAKNTVQNKKRLQVNDAGNC